MINIRIARELIRIARLLVAKDWTQDIQKKRPDLDAEAVNGVLRGYSDPKEQKMVAYWLLDKKTIDCPFDQNTSKSIEQAWSMLNDPLNTKLKLDFMRFRSPAELISFVNGQASSGGVRAKFNPDTEPTFSNKKNLGNGVVVYEVEDSKAGQIAVRKALDDAWGPNFNGWCLAARKSKFGPRQLEEFDKLTESQKELLGFYSDDDLAVAWGNWKLYSKTPKRAAFKSGKIFAFSASDKQNNVMWWDKNDDDTYDIPGVNVLDDFDFLAKYGKYNIINNPDYRDQNPELFDKAVQYIENIKAKKRVSRDPGADPNELAKMRDDEDDEVRRNVARNPNTPVETLLKMLDDEDEYVRLAVAGNQNTPPGILAKMWDDEDEYIRTGVANNLNTPPEILAEMWNDEDYVVRQNVAENPNTPPGILAKMWDDEDESVRRFVAKNPNTPPETLAKMLNDKNHKVRENALNNPNYRG